METFIEVLDFVKNSNYDCQRQDCLHRFDIGEIDPPIMDIVKGFTEIPCCFTLQSCYGHFLHPFQIDPHYSGPLHIPEGVADIEYRIAYIAVCIQNSSKGEALFRKLRSIPAIDHEYVQFGCAEWFWDQYVNSFVLQVEPKNQMKRDRCIVSVQEAFHIEKIRNLFFEKLRELVPQKL